MYSIEHVAVSLLRLGHTHGFIYLREVWWVWVGLYVSICGVIRASVHPMQRNASSVSVPSCTLIFAAMSCGDESKRQSIYFSDNENQATASLEKLWLVSHHYECEFPSIAIVPHCRASMSVTACMCTGMHQNPWYGSVCNAKAIPMAENRQNWISSTEGRLSISFAGKNFSRIGRPSIFQNISQVCHVRLPWH